MTYWRGPPTNSKKRAKESRAKWRGGYEFKVEMFPLELLRTVRGRGIYWPRKRRFSICQIFNFILDLNTRFFLLFFYIFLFYVSKKKVFKRLKYLFKQQT